jgi:HEAT repeat protein
LVCYHRRGTSAHLPTFLAETLTMLGTSSLIVAALLAVQAAGPIATRPTPKAEELSPEEETVRSAGLGTDGPALLEFFRARSHLETDWPKLQALARQLGDPVAAVRARAAAALVARGPLAVPVLRQAANDLANPDAAGRARQCLQVLEGSTAAALPAAAARLLALRKPPGTAEVLLDYLPFADDTSVAEHVIGALAALAYTDGRPDPALLRALGDAVAVRRAAAGEALCRADRPEQRPAVRKLLHDPSAGVRLRAAMALARQQDAEAIPVLIDLLGELPAAQRRPAEEVLQELAGEWAPGLAHLKDDEISRRICRDAWAAWWRNTNGPALLAEFRKRTPTPADRQKIAALIDKLGADEFPVRERASADLVAYGPLAAPQLGEAAHGADLERARRATTCLERIARADKNPLPVAAARLLVLRRPPGAVQALLDYLPWAGGEQRVGAIEDALADLAVADGKPDPVVVRALEDPVSLRRLSAAVALARRGGPPQWPALRRLLHDPDPELRVRLAAALAAGGDRQAVPALIEALAEAPPAQAGEAADVLHRLAGSRGPEVPLGETVAVRQKCRDAWAAWWQAHGASTDLARLSASEALLGYTLLVEVEPGGNGRVRELGRDGKTRWQIDNLLYPVDAQVVGGNRVLVAEYNGMRITERDLQGNIVWRKDGLRGRPVNVQRLPGGNTFIATDSMLLEVDRAGKEVFSHALPGVIAACKARNGEIFCLTGQGLCVRLDARGKEVKSFPAGRDGGWTSGIDASPDGKVLIAQPNHNQVSEMDREGKVVWHAAVPGITTATRLPNGHVLAASYMSRRVVELDRTGRTVWQQQGDRHVFRARRR